MLLKRWVRWSGITISFRIFRLLWSTRSKALAGSIKQKKMFFQDLSCFFDDPGDVDNLISFRIDWFDLFAVQRTLKSLLQDHSSKTSILWHSAFFMVQCSHPYMTTRKTIALTVGKVMSLLFNMLSRFVMAFLPRSKCLLISVPWKVWKTLVQRQTIYWGICGKIIP